MHHWGFSRERELIGCIRLQKGVYYKELTHMISEDDKSQDLLGKSAVWRPKRADGVVLIQRPIGSNPERADVSDCEGRKKLMSQFGGSQAGEVLPY